MQINCKSKNLEIKQMVFSQTKLRAKKTKPNSPGIGHLKLQTSRCHQHQCQFWNLFFHKILDKFGSFKPVPLILGLFVILIMFESSYESVMKKICLSRMICIQLLTISKKNKYFIIEFLCISIHVIYLLRILFVLL